MNDRIAQMARDAGFDPYDMKESPRAALSKFAAFARLVAEDCAGIVDSADTPDGWSNSHIADAIRARYK